MAPKKSGLRNLAKKGISAKKADAVKGGRKKEPKERIALNHNLVVR